MAGDIVDDEVPSGDVERSRRPSMASPVPGGNETVDRYKVTDEDFETLQSFNWSATKPEILSDLEFISTLPKNAALDYDALGPSLPPKDADAPTKTLFIDLDETIAHTCLGGVPKPRSPDLIFTSEGDGAVANVYFRPWVSDFLKVVSEYFEVILFTASLKPYADLIVDELDTEKHIRHRLYREHCTQYGSTDIFFKDIHGTGRALEDSIVVDNRLISFGLNLENGIFVSSFSGQSDDTELLHLLPLLIALSRQEDVRVSLNQSYRLAEIVERFRIDNGSVHSSHDEVEETAGGSGVSHRRSISPDLASRLLAIGSPTAHQLHGGDRLGIHAAAISVIGAFGPTTSPALTDPPTSASDIGPGDDDLSNHFVIESSQPTPTVDMPGLEIVSSAGGEDMRRVSSEPSRSLEHRHNSQRSGSRHLAALSRISPAFPEEPKEGRCLKKPSRIECHSRSESSISSRRMVLPPNAPQRRRWGRVPLTPKGPAAAAAAVTRCSLPPVVGATLPMTLSSDFGASTGSPRLDTNSTHRLRPIIPAAFTVTTSRWHSPSPQAHWSQKVLTPSPLLRLGTPVVPSTSSLRAQTPPVWKQRLPLY